jgi:hypothetical protein
MEIIETSRIGPEAPSVNPCPGLSPTECLLPLRIVYLCPAMANASVLTVYLTRTNPNMTIGRKYQVIFNETAPR